MRVPRDIFIMSTAFFFIFLGAGSMQQFLHLVPVIRGHTEYVLVTLYGSFMVCRLVACYTIIRLGDFVSEILGGFTYFLFVFCLGIVKRVEVLYFLAVAWGWGAASMWISSSCHILEVSRYDRYGTSSGFFYMMTLMGRTAGIFVLQAIATLTVKLGGGPGYIALGAGAITAVGLGVMTGVSKDLAPKESFSVASFVEVAFDSRMILVGIIQLLGALSFGILLGVFRAYSHKALGTQYPAVAYFLAQALISFGGGSLSDVLGRDRILRCGFLLSAGGMFIAGMWTGRAMISLSLCGLALGIQAALVPTASTAFVGDIVSGPRRHFGLGAIFMWRDFGVVVALLVGKALSELVSHRAAFFAFAGLFVLCSFVTMLLTRRLRAVQRVL